MSRWLKWGLIALLIIAAIIGAGAYAVLNVPSVQDALFDRMARAALLRDRTALLKDDALRAFVCGSSSPMPDPRRAQACIAVVAGGKIYIVDTGSRSYGNLEVWGVPIKKLGAVFIQPLHSDQLGALGEYNMNSWALGRKAPLDVYGPPGVERVVAGFSEAYALDQTYRTAHHGAELMSPDIWKMVAHPVAMPGDATPAHDRTTVVF